MNIIINNPYRQLGVYSNSPIKERVANHNRLKAFLKVGKHVDFPLDLSQYLTPIDRTSESVAQAEASLALSNEQIKYAQFWFMKATPLDDIAFNHLFAGNMGEAINIWMKKDSASSLQNRIVCALIQEDYSNAIACAELLYTQYAVQFVLAIVGKEDNTLSESIALSFIDVLCEEIASDVILPLITNDTWKSHVVEKSVKPLIEQIQSVIEIAKSSRGKGATARYNAGVKLMKDTAGLLQQLKVFSSETDLQYQMIADKLGLEILQCGIDYFNEADEPDAAYKAMQLQSYAMTVVVSKTVKDRCKENVDILKQVIKNLPPLEIFAEDKAIKEELRKFHDEFYSFKGCKDALFNCVPFIVSIKSKLGIQNKYYIEISTLIANILLGFVIETFNSHVNDELKNMLQKNEKETLVSLMWMLRFCWNIIVNIERLDTSKEFQTNRLSPNENAIRKFIAQLDPQFDIKDIRNIAIRSIKGYLVEPFLQQYVNTWYSQQRAILMTVISGFSVNPFQNYSTSRDIYAEMGVRIPPTQGFMSEWEHEDFIDLRTEEDYYNECKEIYAKKELSNHAYNNYIEKYPEGKYLKEVQSFKDTLKYESYLYEKYKETISSCKDYIKRYPNGWYLSSIKNRLDDLIFKQYKSAHNLEEYIVQYPNGRNVSKADDLLFEQYKLTNRLKDYLAHFPKGRNAHEAENLLKKKNDSVMWIVLIFIAILFFLVLYSLYKTVLLM
ncbi:hypothetical protein Bacsa_1701 [Phocaeicola salanitronis DSM 18170]|uniref:Uncharacterized protein n=1 Tax=Phocaeicola salanitronis (strain DSM 18170 / JCM 13657 / CCUG 60908 / BL78) TaxID=667015 RepID=F0R0R0_PHOSB|nr:hypothetical protein [Phocaeicola salanitronis]ADY36264.1 hypothetical protein Bacsa_1701 [Phocaeicola salanitronis DSM 18170]